MVESLIKELIIADLQWDYDKGTQGGGDDAKIGIWDQELEYSSTVIIRL